MQRFADLLDEVAQGVGATPSYTWVDQDFLTEQGVERLGGPGLAAAVAAATRVRRHAGARRRPAACGGAAHPPGRRVSARDTLAWADATPDAVQTGIGRDRERELLEDLARPLTAEGQPVSTLASCSAALSAPPRRTGR